ncbi:MAG: AAA family ATPase [Actinomycetota bacterium]
MAWKPPPLPGRLSLEGEPPLVGRRAALETIEQAWQRVEAGQPQTIFIGGEPGAGKTRLVSEAAAALIDADAVVLYGASFVDFDVPYQPFVGCVDHLLENTPAGSLREIIPDSSSYLVRLAPSITRHRADLKPSDRDSPEHRSDLFAAYQDLLISITGQHPVVLVLEDLHWARESTRLMLSFLVERTESTQLLILGTLRTTAPDRSDELTASIANLYRLSGVHRIDLSGLEVTDITQFIMANGAHTVGEARSEAAILRDRTGGNPFFIRELLSQPVHLVQGSRTVPESIHAAIDTRLLHFDPETREVVGLAAALGDEFDSSTLAAVVGDSGTVLRAIDLARKAGLITDQPDGEAGHYRFRHALSRQAVLDRMSVVDRTQAHADIAKAIEISWASSPYQHAVLAHHYHQAAMLGFDDEASKHAAIAGTHAQKTLAHEDAARWFLLAAEVDNDEIREEALLSAGRNLVLAYDFEEARRAFGEVADSIDPTRAARAAIGLDDASWRSGLDGNRSLLLIERALEGLGPDPANPLRVQLLSSKVRALAYSGGDTARAATEALGAARATGEARLVADALSAVLMDKMTVPAAIDESMMLSRELLELSIELRNHDRTANGAAVLGGLAYMAGKPNAADEADRELARAIEAGDLGFWRTLLGCGLYSRYFRQGDLGPAREQSKALLGLWTNFEGDGSDGPYGFQMFMIERESDNLAGVASIIDRVDKEASLWRPGLLALLVELDRLEEASPLLDRVFHEEMVKGKRSAERPAVMALLAEAIVATGNRDLAASLRPALLDFSGFNLMAGNRIVVFGATDRYIGQIDALLGLPTAESYFDAALALDSATEAPLHEVESLIAYATYLDKSVDHRRIALASEYRLRARKIAERKSLVRQLNRLDAATGIRSDRPAGLTPREVGVLRLVAEGLSNKKIADRLFISENTAANHVRSILMKTQAPNRTKAAIFAAEKGLLE